MSLSREQRAELFRLRAQSRLAVTLMEDAQRRLRKLLAGEEALSLAVEERLGHEPEDGTKVTTEDERRAQEILRQCWSDEI